MKRDDDDDDSEPRKKKKKRRKKGKKAGKPNYNVDAATFVEVWSSSNTVDEVMTRTGLPRNAVYSRVNSYRKKNIKLKRMNRPPRRMDIDALNAIVEKYAPVAHAKTKK